MGPAGARAVSKCGREPAGILTAVYMLFFLTCVPTGRLTGCDAPVKGGYFFHHLLRVALVQVFCCERRICTRSGSALPVSKSVGFAPIPPFDGFPASNLTVFPSCPRPACISTGRFYHSFTKSVCKQLTINNLYLPHGSFKMSSSFNFYDFVSFFNSGIYYSEQNA